ncbi:MAG TPA: DinB family protein, partial [Candidatus Limnocylindrales bacterium]|nr:DinB family protein [Candidatus Limnocylindrales bacterium]
MNFELGEACDVLERGPRVVTTLVEPVSDDWLSARPAHGEWNAHQVVAHLLYIEQSDWMVRTRHILEADPSVPFPAVEHGDQSARFPGATTVELARQLAELRDANLRELRALELSDADLDQEGMHPSLGPVTLRQLLATWVVHDHNHARQLHQALASHYAADVGPWRSLLGVL